MLSAAVLLVVVACRLCALLFSVGVLSLLLLVLLRSLLRVAFEEASSASAAARKGADAAMPKKCQSSKHPVLGPSDCWVGRGGAVAIGTMAKVSGSKLTGRTCQLPRSSKPLRSKQFAPAQTLPSSCRLLRGARAVASSVQASCSEPPREPLPTAHGP